MLPPKFISTFFIFIFAGTFFCYVQNYSLYQLDSINEEFWNKGEVEKEVNFNFKALNKYRKQNNVDGIIVTYINIANTFSYLNKHEEAIKYLEIAKTELHKTENPLLYAKIYNQYGKSYSLLGFYQQSNNSLNKAIYHLKKIPDQNQREKNLYFANVWKWYNFNKLGQTDSVKIIQFKNKNIFPENPLVYEKIASFHIWTSNDLDSAEYYLQRAHQLVKIDNLSEKALIFATTGDFYMKKGDYNKAAKRFLQSLSLYEKLNYKHNQRILYLRVAKAYKALGNTKVASEYFHSYSLINYSISNSDKKIVSMMMEKFAQEKENEEKKKRKKIYGLTGVIIIIFIILILCIRKAYLKKQKKKDIIIKEKSLETKQLKRQVNTAFDKVMELARNNDPFFLVRFKEVYPEFYQKLILKCPDLTEHDIKFCAYLRLNLTNKEILKYENISLRTIESKKYRLKKKLGLAKKINLNKWILEL